MSPTNSSEGRAPSTARRARARSLWSDSRIESCILAALQSGPKGLGELLNYALNSVVHASDRDAAIERLLARGVVRRVELPHPNLFYDPLRGVELVPVESREEVARG